MLSYIVTFQLEIKTQRDGVHRARHNVKVVLVPSKTTFENARNSQIKFDIRNYNNNNF